jgi:hypothetical protein
MAFETHANALRYKAAGFTDAQVEALIEADREIVSARRVSQLVTKADVQAELAKLKFDLLIWVTGAVIVIQGFSTTTLYFAALRGPGRPGSVSDTQWAEARGFFEAGETSVAKVARKIGVSRQALYRKRDAEGTGFGGRCGRH